MAVTRPGKGGPKNLRDVTQRYSEASVKEDFVKSFSDVLVLPSRDLVLFFSYSFYGAIIWYVSAGF